jgi:hypothetical protein
MNGVMRWLQERCNPKRIERYILRFILNLYIALVIILGLYVLMVAQGIKAMVNIRGVEFML